MRNDRIVQKLPLRRRIDARVPTIADQQQQDDRGDASRDCEGDEGRLHAGARRFGEHVTEENEATEHQSETAAGKGERPCGQWDRQRPAWCNEPGNQCQAETKANALIPAQPKLGLSLGTAGSSLVSDYGKGDWCTTVDGLYWRFIDKHRDFFASSPRLALMPNALDRLDAGRRKTIFAAAEAFLDEFTRQDTT